MCTLVDDGDGDNSPYNNNIIVHGGSSICEICLSADVHTAGFDEYTLKKECAARTYRGVIMLHKRLYINILYYVILLYVEGE